MTLPQTDWINLKLNGKIKTISKRRYSARERDGKIQKRGIVPDPLENWDITFNRKGYLMSKKCYDTQSELVLDFRYEYKRRKLLTEKHMYDGSGVIWVS